LSNHQLSSSGFEESVGKVAKIFQSQEKRRELLIKESRDVILLCSKAIVNVHSGKIDEAKQSLSKVKAKLKKLTKTAEQDLARYIQVAQSEYVEASAFLKLIEENDIPSIEDFEVEPSSYILGMLDVIGEVKRKVFDDVRTGKREEAEKLFNYSETIYSSIKPLSAFDNLVPGIRKKLDVDRILLEDMRALITEEVRRDKLLKQMEKLTKGD
jgi:Predicted RNA-binding protein of the translin family